LKKHRFVFAGCEVEVAEKVIDLTAQALELQPAKPETLPKKPAKRRRKKIDLLAVPDDEPAMDEALPKRVIQLRQPTPEPAVAQQLALF
jgi:hypothetical protein